MLKRREQNLQRKKNQKKTITALQESLDANKNVNQETKEASRELGGKKAELEKIIDHKTKGAILRTKCRWYIEGEKKHKIFPKP